MRYVDVGGARLSVIGLGTWQFGSKEWGYGAGYAATETVALVQRALDLGVNLIDTAEVYATGNSERLVGGALGDRRAEAFLATKVWPVLPIASIVEQRGRASAARLGVETLDLYQVHWPNPVVPISQTMAGMRRLSEAGVVRHVGVSNFSLRRWQAAEEAYGGPVLSNQVKFSLVARRPERNLVPWASQAGRVVIAYSPLGQGLLSARYGVGHPPSGGVRRANALFTPENLRRAEPLLDALRAVAGDVGATPAQVALAWVVDRPNVVTIPGASSVAQLEANAAAADLELSAEHDARLSEAAERFAPTRGVGAQAERFTGLLRGSRGGAARQ
jgi:aryl-alcohol dehydrogenase-like predicted oxidoreductase